MATPQEDFQEFLDAAPRKGDMLFGKCVSVVDGDTIKILVDKSPYRIHLSGIIAPEQGQEYSTKAAQALASKVKGKQLTVEVLGGWPFPRLLGKVMLNGESIELWLVRNGWAWQYVKYDRSKKLRIAQELARKEGKGLWAGEANGGKPMPPWEYRERQRALSQIKKDKSTGGSFWLNTGSGTRHNEGCQHYRNTKRGRLCGPEDGKACGMCGG